MAEKDTQYVVNEAQSMGNSLPVDEPATTSKVTTAGGGKVATNASNHVEESQLSTNELAPQPPATETSANQAVPPANDTIAIEEEGQPTAEERVAQQAAIDASGGSDTDTSKDGTGQGADEASGHVRSGSVKKPISFKAVSVTKNFLAKSATIAPTVKSTGEKGKTPMKCYGRALG